MAGVAGEDVGPDGQRLVELRRELDHVVGDVDPRDAGKGDVRQQHVQPVAELVEQDADVERGQEGG